MAETDYSLKFKIEAEDNASKDIQKATKSVEDLAKKTETTGKTSSNSFGSIGTKAIAMGNLVATAIQKTISAVSNYASECVELAEENETMAKSYQYLTEQAGISGDALLNKLKEVSQGTATETSLMQASNKALALGVAGDVDQMSQLMEIAMVKGQEFGESTEQAFNDMITGLGRNSAMILDNLGIIVDSDEAYNTYASSIGKSADQLTEMEQKQALVNAVIKNSQSDLEQFSNISVSGTTRMKTAFTELQTTIGKMLLPAWNSLAGIVADDINKLNTMIQASKQSFITAGNNVLNSIKNVINNIIQAGNNLRTSFQTITTSISQLFFGLSADGQSASMNFGQTVLLVLQKITQGISVVVTAFSQLTGLFSRGTKNASNRLIGIKNSLSKMFEASSDGHVKSLKERINDGIRGFGTAEVSDEVDELADTLNGFADQRSELSGQITYDDDQLYTSFLNLGTGATENTSAVASALNKITESTDDATASTQGSSKAKEEESEETKQLKDAIEQLNEEMYAQIKMERENAKTLYEEYGEAMEDAYDKVKDLKDEIVDLQKELSDLGTDKDNDLASNYIEARDTIKDLNEEYGKLIERVYNSGGDAEKHGIKESDFEKYVEAMKELEQYKNLPAEVMENLNTVIAEQDRRNSLTNFEQITETYEKEKAELEAKIEEKQTQLETEVQLYLQYYNQRQELDDQYKNLLHQNLEERKKEEEAEIKRLQKMIELMQEAGVSTGSSTGHKAGGGDVYGGNAYVVGEHGPELFIPNQSGSITPNNQITNNNGIEINISGVSVRSDSDIQAIADEITRRIKLEKSYGIIS